MKRDSKLICVKCKKEKPRREIKRLRDGLICKQCIVEKRKEHREFLKRKVCGIRKRSDLEKEWKEKRERKERERISFKKQIVKPIIRGVKKIIRTKQTHLYLKKDEKKFLYFKCINQGMTSEEASKRVKDLCSRMSELVIKLRTKIKDEKELNKRFKEEFAKMCEELN